MKFTSPKDLSNKMATARRNRCEPYSISRRPLSRVLRVVRRAVRSVLDPAPPSTVDDDLSALMSAMDLSATGQDAVPDDARDAQAAQEEAIGGVDSLPVEVLEDSDRLRSSRAVTLDEFFKVGVPKLEPEEESLLSRIYPYTGSSKGGSLACLRPWKGVPPYETSPAPEDFMKVIYLTYRFYLAYLQPMVLQRAEHIVQSYRQSELALSNQNLFPPQTYTVFSAPHIYTQDTTLSLEDFRRQRHHARPFGEESRAEEEEAPLATTEPNSPEPSHQELHPQPSASGQTSSIRPLIRSSALYARQSGPRVARDYGARSEDDRPRASSQAASGQVTAPSSPVASPLYGEFPQNRQHQQHTNRFAPFEVNDHTGDDDTSYMSNPIADADMGMADAPQRAPIRTHEDLMAAANRLAQPPTHWQESQEHYTPAPNAFQSAYAGQANSTFTHPEPLDGMDTEADASLGEAAYRMRDDPSVLQDMNSGYNQQGVQITTFDAPQPTDMTDPTDMSPSWVQTNTDAQQQQQYIPCATEEQRQETRLWHALRERYNIDDERTNLLMSFWSAVWQFEADDEQNWDHLAKWIDALRQWSGDAEQQFWDLLKLFLHTTQFATDARNTWDLVSHHMNVLKNGATEELGVWGLLSMWLSLRAIPIASHEQQRWGSLHEEETWRLLECWVQLWPQTRNAEQTNQLLIHHLEGLQQQQQVASDQIDISLLHSTGVQIHNDAPQKQNRPYVPNPQPESESIDELLQHDQEQQQEERQRDYEQSREYLHSLYQGRVQAQTDLVGEEEEQSEIQPADAPSEPPTDPSVAAHDAASNSWESVLAASQEAPAPASAPSTSPPDPTSAPSSTQTAQTQASEPSPSDNVHVPRETLEKLFDALVETVGDADLSQAANSTSPICHCFSDQRLLESLEMAPRVLRQQQQASSSSERKRKRSQDHEELGDSSSLEERPKKGKRAKRSHREDSNDDPSWSPRSETTSRPSKRRHDDPSSDPPEKRKRSEIQQEEAAPSSSSSSSAPAAQTRVIARPVSILRRRPCPPPSFPGALYDRSAIFPAPALPPRRREHVRFVGDVDVPERAQMRPIMPVTRNTAGALAERRERLAEKSLKRTCSRTLAAIGQYFGFA